MTCPVDVYLPKGRTILHPTQTSFLPALNIATKICQGQIEFIRDIHLIPKGTIIGKSQASLLSLLRMAPIPKKIEISTIFVEDYLLYPPIFDVGIKIIDTIRRTAENIGCIGAAIGYPTIVNFERAVVMGYTNLLCVCMETQYSFEHGEKIISQVLINQLRRNGNI